MNTVNLNTIQASSLAWCTMPFLCLGCCCDISPHVLPFSSFHSALQQYNPRFAENNLFHFLIPLAKFCPLLSVSHVHLFLPTAICLANPSGPSSVFPSLPIVFICIYCHCSIVDTCHTAYLLMTLLSIF